MDVAELDKASSSLFSRFRSPSFQLNEVKALLQLIEKNKYVLLNKSTKSAANNAKERAWRKITAEFCKQNLGPKRSMDVLRTKWENLKRNSRKSTKDIMDEDCDFTKDELNNTIRMICSAENSGCDIQNSCEDGSEFRHWGSDEEDNPAFDLGGANPKESKFNVASGFSPRDCRVLLHCVRQEKKVLFSNSPLFKRQQAWERITEVYNSQSPRKKTAKELNKKFNTIKAVARKVNVRDFFKNKKRKYEQSDDENKPIIERIKSEPVIECSTDVEGLESEDEVPRSSPVDAFSARARARRGSDAPDPLNIAGSDSGLGSITDTKTDSKDAARLKLELINYKMETAKLERKRIEEAIKGDEREREVRVLEQALRMRAARLAASAAEARLPPAHPAARHTPEEKRAYNYFSNNQLDIG